MHRRRRACASLDRNRTGSRTERDRATDAEEAEHQRPTHRVGDLWQEGKKRSDDADRVDDAPRAPQPGRAIAGDRKLDNEICDEESEYQDLDDTQESIGAGGHLEHQRADRGTKRNDGKEPHHCLVQCA
ncbi:MAG: hypothetical protein M3541_17915 [Acidobacteriota bacterium]|nr:hypothetical protein [Acidobacteriota bacterium]MDQ3420619.1 hypothetical protein [Acidobacteriota bacterium]